MNTKYHLENREILNDLVVKIFEVLERVIVKENWERVYNNISQSIPDSIELDKHLILTKQAELKLKDAKQDLLDFMQQVLIENNH